MNIILDNINHTIYKSDIIIQLLNKKILYLKERIIIIPY